MPKYNHMLTILPRRLKYDVEENRRGIEKEITLLGPITAQHYVDEDKKPDLDFHRYNLCGL
jgi:hypothetical protein